MASTLTPQPWSTFLDGNGNPLSGGKLYTYVAGSSTPSTVYQDAASAVPHANPIILDSAGRTTIFLPATGAFKYVLKTSADVLVREQDNITAGVLSPDLIALFAALRQTIVNWTGSDAAGLMGTAVPSGNTKSTRAPGTALFELTAETSILFEATLFADAGATASVSLFSAAAPDTPIVGSTLTSTSADGALVKSAAIVLPIGSYFIKGHSTHATLQAYGLGYRIVPSA